MGSGARQPASRESVTTEVFADVVCPFTHLGLRRLVDRRAQLGLSTIVHVRAWPLELVHGEPLRAELVAEEVRALRDQVAPDLFEGFDPTRFPRRSLPAMAVAAAAHRASAQLGERVSLALRHALFEEGRDVASPDVLADIAAAAGLGRPEAVDEAAVLADWHEGKGRGVLGSPHFFVGAEGFFCPSLEIRRVGDHLQVKSDPAGFEAFLAHAFPTA